MKRILTIIAIGALFTQMEAREILNYKVSPKNNVNNTNKRLNALAGACEPATQSADLDINNVRTKILNGGDMWWDLNTARYEIPKVNDANAIRKNSLFAGALWIGGLEDGSNNLKLAAMTYRQRGSDFWPGPLDINTANTEASRCESYDKIWKITRDELETAEASNWSDLSSNILEWPGGRNRGFSGISSANEAASMAPFFDANSNGIYEPSNGEYPVLYTDKAADNNTPGDQPDMMLWYVYNDNGNIHSETGGIPIGLELQLQSFAFATNDEINNMTFYRSTIINRGQTELKETYMGQWVDPDLGNFADDYVGCDVKRALGICYNGDDNDEGVLGYGLNPPTIGIDYFEGPLDENGDELGLSHFMYFNNDANPISGNPSIAIDFYNYLQGKWKNGQTVRWGDRNGSGGTVETPWMWPFDTILPGQSLWTERTSGNTPNDRRFVQSSGPFTLKPGVVNYITIGAVWARATSGGALGSLELLRKASDKAQKLFNNRFDLIDGPEAPEVAVQELENEVVLTFLNTNNDKVENYVDTIKSESGADLEYKFQGYMVYQLADGTVNTGDLDNVDKARLVFQCDIEDEFDQIINREFDPIVSADIPVEKVDGENIGIVNTISIKEDAFSTASNKTMVNFKTYYFLVLSYAVIANDPLKSDPNQFLAGRNNIQVYKVIPHKNEPEKSGIKINSDYGSGPKIRTISGTGNGGNALEFTSETVDAILANRTVDQPVYMGGSGPVNIKIVDPVKVPVADFRLEILDTVPTINSNSTDSIRRFTTYWKLTNLTSNEVVYSDKFLNEEYESVQGKDGVNGNTKPSPNLHDWGMAVNINQVIATGNDSTDSDNNLLSWEVAWEDEGRQWLTALTDNDGSVINNWIRAGKTHTAANGAWSSDPYADDYWYESRSTQAIDATEVYEKIWNGRIAPYTLAARAGLDNSGRNTFGPALATSPVSGPQARLQMNNLASVNLVITKDKSKWTRCVVVETGDNENRDQHIGNAEKFDIRKSPSVDRNGNTIGGETGRGWFPGYAINMETGERMNIIFGEDSYMTGANGTDMKWNPTSQFFSASSTYPIWGGKHWIYVMSTNDVGNFKAEPYDEGAGYLSRFNAASSPFFGRTQMMNTAMWVLPAIMAPGFEIGADGVPPTDFTIKLRVSKPYATRDDDKLPVYEFNTKDVAPEGGEEAKTAALDLVSIVPNPYYAYSEYEGSPVDNRVKITNLPPKCTVSIFSTQGLLIKTFNKDDEATFVEWDLKNQSRVPIAGGVYIIHVKTPEGKEKTIKWFGVMRSLDLDSY
jgi:hypothetical protein